MRAARPQFILAVFSCAVIACVHGVKAVRYKKLEIRLVSENGGRDFPIWGEAGALALESEPLFSGKDFAAIETSRGGDDKITPSLALRFTKEASVRFEELTRRRTGRKLAVVVDGKVVAAPKILHSFTTGLFEITGPSATDVGEMYRLIAGDAR
jgi:preprotein translocase subunit SecD